MNLKKLSLASLYSEARSAENELRRLTVWLGSHDGPERTEKRAAWKRALARRDAARDELNRRGDLGGC